MTVLLWMLAGLATAADDYAHIDLIAGLRAGEEVHPVLAEWLAAHD